MEFEVVSDGAKIPVRATSGSAGYDLFALESRTITGGEGSVLVPTGIAVKIPPGYYGRIAPRSGLALKQHIAVNAGVIDADYYPGPVGVILFGTKNGHSYTIERGERFAQIIITAIAPADDRAAAQTHVGFGSTGK